MALYEKRTKQTGLFLPAIRIGSNLRFLRAELLFFTRHTAQPSNFQLYSYGQHYLYRCDSVFVHPQPESFCVANNSFLSFKRLRSPCHRKNSWKITFSRLKRVWSYNIISNKYPIVNRTYLVWSLQHSMVTRVWLFRKCLTFLILWKFNFPRDF